MSKEYEFMCKGHNSIYDNNYLEGNYEKRQFKVIFNEPECGVNEETGVCLIINGFGGNIESNVYKKMRTEFSDKYNLVTIQCEYFGSEFMDNQASNFKIESVIGDIKKFEETYCDINKFDINKFDINKFMADDSFRERIELNLEAELNESIYELNDMGIMQAVDNITATLNVIGILFNNKLKFNTKKIIIMGQSHGAYLAYLCNALCRNLYTHILDNSAWVYPLYIKGRRRLNYELENTVNIMFKYKISNIIDNSESLAIDNMYGEFYNTAKIICYHGSNDTLISLEDKVKALKDIKNVIIKEISEEKVDGQVFKSTGHGLNADFLKLFEKFYGECRFEKYDKLEFDNVVHIFGNIEVNYTNGIPEVRFC